MQVDAVSAWTQQAAVYNLTVDTAHTYYVEAGDTFVLVHNSSPTSGTPACGTQLPLFILRDGEIASPAQMAASSGGPTAGKRVPSSIRNQMVRKAQAENDSVLTCWRCGQTTKNPANVQIGHVNVPRSKGGNLTEGNLCIEGMACNGSAQDRGAPSVGMSCAERGSCGAPRGRSD
ncbi:hypothetical protein GCM10010251_36920 [Streptomyces aurantiogriseus]|uniref:Intein C-terminal splicing domain-containing protein n=1 Tax=Streptomyces aurantiogriseus TaxID=66870 RepID=A0A918CCJ8_9ACTN|nr:hypothetical protein GCM10010251_36920 [Streptomyces aurantiogriseus]